MKKSLGFAILGLAASAVLASGSVYAAYVLTDNANPFGVKISISRQAGYYLMGDASITGDPDLAWDIAGGIPLTDGVPVELALPANAQFKVAYFENGTIAEDAWYNALAATYPFASNEDNVQVLYARTYQITFDETEKKISIADKNGSIYTPGYYLADVSVANDFSKPLNDAEPGDNTAQKNEGYALTKDHVYKVMHTDGYAAPAVATKGAQLGGPHAFASNVAEEGGIQINYASTYGVYYKEAEGIWLADKNAAPYAAFTENYFIKVGEADPVASSDPGTDLGQWLGVELAANAVVTFMHSEIGYALDTGVYKNGFEGPVLANDSYQVTEEGTYNIYLNASHEVYFDKQTPTPTGITATVDGSPIVLTDIKSGGTNKAEYSIELAVGQTIAFKDNGNDVHFYHYDGTAIDDGTTYTATKAGAHMFYYNADSQMYVGQPADPDVTYTITGNPNWVANGGVAVFAWACKDGWADGHWYPATCGAQGSGGDGAAELTITFDAPADRTCGLLVRCVAGTTTPDWSATGNNVGRIYNQTENLPTMSGAGSYTCPGWKDYNP